MYAVAVKNVHANIATNGTRWRPTTTTLIQNLGMKSYLEKYIIFTNSIKRILMYYKDRSFHGFVELGDYLLNI